MRQCLAWTGLICLVFLCSCTAQNAPPPATAKVAGTVSLDGSPMKEGEIRFSVMGQPPKLIPVKDGSFSGEAFLGKNQVEVVLDVDGPPSTTDPNVHTKVNKVSPEFSGPNSKLSADVPAAGATDLKFEVKSK
jgi:hypothetical protein